MSNKNSNIFIKASKNNNEDNYVSISTPPAFHKFASKIKQDKDKDKDKDNSKGKVELNNLFGGKKRRKSSKKLSKKKSSKKSSHKKPMKKKLSRSKSSKKKSSKKSSRKKSSKKSSRKRSSRKMKRTESYKPKSSSYKPKKAKRPMVPAMAEFLKLRSHVAKVMGIKPGLIAVKLASIYKNQAAKQNPGMESIDIMKKAKELFDKDSQENRKKNLSEAEKISPRKKKYSKSSSKGEAKK
jgi:hypothetical protein